MSRPFTPRFTVHRAPQIDSDCLVVRHDDDGARLVGRQIAGRGRVVPQDAPWTLTIGRLIEIYSSATDLGRARGVRLDAHLRDFLGLQAFEHPDVDVDGLPLDVDGYI